MNLLDTDWYKLSVWQLVHNHFPDLQVRYELIDRTKKLEWNYDFNVRVKNKIEELLSSRFTENDCDYLKGRLDKKFVDFLYNFKFPQKGIYFSNYLVIEGRWEDVIALEVPILAILSEEYYRKKPHELGIIRDKTNNFADLAEKHDIHYNEFGTRRRRSKLAQNIVIDTLYGRKGFSGTSNVALAKEYNIRCVGTYGHELPMGLSSIVGPRLANQLAMRLFEYNFPSSRLISLPDTFTTDVFLQDADPTDMKRWAVRQDSGDPFRFVDKMLTYYEKIGVNAKEKHILFSDNLNIVKCAALKNYCQGKIMCSFGVGTSLTNPFDDALNIVIKMTEANGKAVVKLSDDPSKATGNSHIVELLRKELNEPRI